ncbi:sugar phosphate isomerase/epimerase [Anaerolineales bacterium HSG6]|nr:sugar phosphate isomerase/epimerase [Anaerolineales bacterium HSG6]
MTIPIAVQLYTVREALAQDFAGTMQKIADIGYVGVEVAALPDHITPTAAKETCDQLGLMICSAHTPLPLGDEQNQVLDMVATLGCSRIVNGYMPLELYQTIDQIKQLCDQFNEANQVAQSQGYTLGLHNHWWEFEAVEGQYPYQIWLERLDSSIFFEVDTYWVETAGLNAAEVIKALGQRAPLLHLKDGPADVPESNMVAVGDGRLDFSAIVNQADHAEWLIVELDRCDTDMLTAVEKSYHYLVTEGLAHGR